MGSTQSSVPYLKFWSYWKYNIDYPIIISVQNLTTAREYPRNLCVSWTHLSNSSHQSKGWADRLSRSLVTSHHKLCWRHQWVKGCWWRRGWAIPQIEQLSSSTGEEYHRAAYHNEVGMLCVEMQQGRPQPTLRFDNLIVLRLINLDGFVLQQFIFIMAEGRNVKGQCLQLFALARMPRRPAFAVMMDMVMFICYFASERN